MAPPFAFIVLLGDWGIREVMKFVDFVSRDAIRTSIDVDDKEQEPLGKVLA